jgi:hypothetical protein
LSIDQVQQHSLTSAVFLHLQRLALQEHHTKVVKNHTTQVAR